MPRRTLGPFSELQDLPPLDVINADQEDVLERMDVVNQVLAANGCNCNGNARGAERDPFFGGDISEIVLRTAPHELIKIDESGNAVTRIVSLKLGTLVVEVDDNNEVCVWIYEESVVTV